MKAYKKSEALILSAYQLYQRLLGEEHPNTKTIKGNLEYVRRFL